MGLVTAGGEGAPRPRVTSIKSDIPYADEDPALTMSLRPRSLYAGRGARIAPELQPTQAPTAPKQSKFFQLSGHKMRKSSGEAVPADSVRRLPAPVSRSDSNESPSSSISPPDSPAYSTHSSFSPPSSPNNQNVTMRTKSRASNASASSNSVIIRPHDPYSEDDENQSASRSPSPARKSFSAQSTVRPSSRMVMSRETPRSSALSPTLTSPATFQPLDEYYREESEKDDEEEAELYDDFDENIDDFYNSESDNGGTPEIPASIDSAAVNGSMKMMLKPTLLLPKSCAAILGAQDDEDNMAEHKASDGLSPEEEKKMKDLQVKQARSDRKIMDLEISNESLMKVNKYLEKRLRSQAKSIQNAKFAQSRAKLHFSSALGRMDDAEFENTSDGPFSDEDEDDDDEEDSYRVDEEEEEDESRGVDATPEELDIERKTKLIEKRMQSHIRFLESSEKVNKLIHSCLFISEALIMQASESIDYEVDPAEVKFGGQVAAGAFDDIGEASFQVDGEGVAVTTVDDDESKLTTIEEEEDEAAGASDGVQERAKPGKLQDSDSDGDYSAFEYKNRVQTFASFLPLSVMDEIEKEIDDLIVDEGADKEGRYDEEIDTIPVAERAMFGIVDEDHDDADFAQRNPAMRL